MRVSRIWLWLVLLALVAVGVARLRFDAEVLNLLPDQLAVAQGLKRYQQNFSNARELIVTVEAATAEESESTARLLAQRLRAETNLAANVVWQPPWMDNPAQATELMAFLWLNQPPAAFGQLTNRLAVGHLTNTLAETRQRLATSLSPADFATGGYDPYGLMQLPEVVSSAAPAMGTGDEMFASPDGTFRLLFVEAKPDLSGYRECRHWLADIERVLADARRSGEIPARAEWHWTGRPVFVTEIASGMQKDMGGSSGGTLATIGILFWLTHRRLRPLVLLLVLLLAILAGTVAFGGLIFGTINVVSLGFASILLGLAEDFGIVLYQESRSHPDWSARELRRIAAPGIFWSAVTTVGAFLTLNLSTLPGLGQLGSFVAIGIVVAAVVMLFGYLPLVLRFRRAADCEAWGDARHERFLLFQPRQLLPAPFSWFITVLLLLAAALVLGKGGVHFDRSSGALEPRNSEAKATLERIKNRLGRGQEPLWLLVSGQDEAQVAQRLIVANAALSQAVSNQQITGFTLPTALWPAPEHQRANRTAVAELLSRRELLRAAALGAGFTTDALLVTDTVLDCWQRALASTNVFWPTNDASRWLLGKFVARTGSGLLAVGFVHSATNPVATERWATHWPETLQREGVMLCGWQLLGATVFDLAMRELPRVVAPIFLLVVLSLWCAFRSLKEVALSLGTLAFSGLLLAAAMTVLRWDWNLMNVMAVPLLLGLGVDFSIHIQLALRRHDGDRLAVRRTMGRALLLAGATTVAGFGSLAFSTNAGIASLGKVCALGITLALVVAVYLLPVWWRVWAQATTVPSAHETK